MKNQLNYCCCCLLATAPAFAQIGGIEDSSTMSSDTIRNHLLLILLRSKVASLWCCVVFNVPGHFLLGILYLFLIFKMVGSLYVCNLVLLVLLSLGCR